MTKKKSIGSAFGSALVKYVQGQNSSAPDSVSSPQSSTDKGADRANTPLAPSLGGLIKSFDSTPEMQTLLNKYFGIGDFLTDLPGMSPNQVAAMADQLDQVNFLLENLPAIEQNLRNYIDGVVKYHEFVNRCVKEGVGGMSKIDKSTLDVFLAHKGYLGEQKKLAADSRIEVQQIEKATEDYVDLQEHKLSEALKRAC